MLTLMIQVWDLEKDACTMVLVPDESEAVKSVNCVLAWSHREVMTANNKGEVHIYDTSSGNVVASFTTDVRTILTLLSNPQRGWFSFFQKKTKYLPQVMLNPLHL